MRLRIDRLRTAKLLAIATVLLWASPGSAVRYDPSVWIAPGGGVLWIPNELGVETNPPFFGGLLGVRLARPLALELRGVFASPKADSAGFDPTLLHVDGSLTWFPAAGPVRPYLTAGAGIVRFSGGGADETKLALSGGLGFLVPFTRSLAVRVDGREVAYKVFSSPAGEEVYKHGPEIFAAISFGFGGTPEDTDRDGVHEREDRCPGTPFGARVDAAGCPIDGDADGVPDGIDRCAGSPQGAVVDVTGCPSDSDRDGVFDGLDACAGTPSGSRVTANGCPLDSDNDSVPDGIDQCEGTVAGCTVNPNGCPTDEDQDGVCDGVDHCAGTPANVRVDWSGCPIEVSTKETELLETGMIRLQNVNFDTGKATIKAESQPALNEVGDILGRWPDLRIEIGGHTDSRGTDARNMALSEARAQSVRDYLLESFPELRPEQFTAKGYGESKPVATNTTELGRARNRRVEFRVLNTEALKRETQKKGLAPKE